MRTKIFGDKKVTIEKFSQKGLRKAKELQDFFNSLIEEDTQIRANKKLSLREEKELLKENLRKIRRC